MTTTPVSHLKEYSTEDFTGGHPSRFQPRPTGLYFDEQTGTGVSLLCKLYDLYSTYFSPGDSSRRLVKSWTHLILTQAMPSH